MSHHFLTFFKNETISSFLNVINAFTINVNLMVLNLLFTFIMKNIHIRSVGPIYVVYI